MEIWSGDLIRHPSAAAAAARLVEDEGYDGLFLPDSQNILPEIWVTLTAAALATRNLNIGTMVSNLITRHPSITASAAASLQELTGRTCVLTVGRGDSSLANLGFGPQKLGAFEAQLARLQAYLRGEAVAFDLLEGADTVSLSSLGYGKVPTESRIRWLPGTRPKVPVEVAASGPKVMAIAGRHADGVMLALGAMPERIKWAMDIVRDAAIAAARTDKVGVTLQIPIACHPDRAVARNLIRGTAASIARWSVMQSSGEGVDERLRTEMVSANSSYNMTQHTDKEASHKASLSDDAVDQIAIAGPPDYCLGRLEEILRLRPDRLVMTARAVDGDPVEREVAAALMVKEIVPAVRGMG